MVSNKEHQIFFWRRFLLFIYFELPGEVFRTSEKDIGSSTSETVRHLYQPKYNEIGFESEAIQKENRVTVNRKHLI